MGELKKYLIEHNEIIKPLAFFVLTFFIFLIAFVHTLRMKSSKVDKYANLALKSDHE